MIYYKLIELQFNQYINLNNKEITNEEIEINGKTYYINNLKKVEEYYDSDMEITETKKNYNDYYYFKFDGCDEYYSYFQLIENVFDFELYETENKIYNYLKTKYNLKILGYTKEKYIKVFYNTEYELNKIIEKILLLKKEIYMSIEYDKDGNEYVRCLKKEYRNNKKYYKIYNYLKNKNNFILKYNFNNLKKITEICKFKSLCYYYY